MKEVKNKDREFTPSYMRKNKDEKIQKKFKLDKKKMILLIATFVAIIIVIVILNIVSTNIKYGKYYKFEEAVIKYGFSDLYNNKKASTNEKITKSEAVKIVVSAVYNTADIDGIANFANETYTNSNWVEFAKRVGIITDTDVNFKNANDFATYSDVIRYFTNAKTKILKLDLDTDDRGIVKDINSYNMDEKFGILDMVNNDIIQTNTSKIKARKNVFKGQVNEIVKNFVENYNTITIQGEKLNINPDKIPSNANDYPYTVISVEKKVYEYDFSGKNNKDFKSPVNLFKEQKDYYLQIKNNTEKYYNKLLNIDYLTISNDNLKKDLRRYLLFDLDDNELNKYIEYVKNNKIKLSGNAKVQIPAIYYDGTYYRVRVKIELKVESADTDKNLLYKDLSGSKDKVYIGDEHTFYIDTYMSNSFGNKTLYNVQKSFYDMLIESQNNSIKLVGE